MYHAQLFFDDLVGDGCGLLAFLHGAAVACFFLGDVFEDADDEVGVAVDLQCFVEIEAVVWQIDAGHEGVFVGGEKIHEIVFVEDGADRLADEACGVDAENVAGGWIGLRDVQRHVDGEDAAWHAVDDLAGVVFGAFANVWHAHVDLGFAEENGARFFAAGGVAAHAAVEFVFWREFVHLAQHGFDLRFGRFEAENALGLEGGGVVEGFRHAVIFIVNCGAGGLAGFHGAAQGAEFFAAEGWSADAAAFAEIHFDEAVGQFAVDDVFDGLLDAVKTADRQIVDARFLFHGRENAAAHREEAAESRLVAEGFVFVDDDVFFGEPVFQLFEEEHGGNT